MSDKNPLPPLSSIADPATRLALQAIYNELLLRRGDVGNGQQQFVTKAQLDTAIAGVTKAGR